MRKDFLGGVLDWTVRDGLSSELSNGQDQIRFRSLYQNAKSNFIELKSDAMAAARAGAGPNPSSHSSDLSAAIPTRTIENYRLLVQDPKQWSEFQSSAMANYFDSAINMFPYERPALASGTAIQDLAAPGTSPQRKPGRPIFGHKLWRIRHKITKPDRYFRIQSAAIDQRFPGGRHEDDDIGDGDLRDLISCFRYIFARNYWNLIVRRRKRAVFAALGVMGSWFLVSLAVALAHVPSNIIPSIWFGDSVGTMSASGHVTMLVLSPAAFLSMIFFVAVIYFSLRAALSRLSDRYEKSMETSRDKLRVAVEERMRTLVHNVAEIFSEIERSRANYNDNLSGWAPHARKWSKVGFWMAKRVEGMERFIQLEMWRIRRIHFAMRLLARWLSILIFVIVVLLGVLVFAGTFWASPQGWVGWLAVGPAGVVALGGVALMSIASFTEKLPDLNVIEEPLKPSAMMRYTDIELHEQIGGLVERLINLYIREEQKFSRSTAASAGSIHPASS